ncbi:MAG: carboxypeptidase-like regulatory domain-containing protein [Halobacteriota archaeon]
MKAVKLISPLVALLLITVFFAGCATITLATSATTNGTLNSAVATNATNSTLNGNATTGSATPSASPSANATSSASSTQKVTTVGAATTETTLSVTNSAPAVGQSVTFTATLISGATPISGPVTIYHYLNGIRYNDTTKYTTFNFPESFGSNGTRSYYATFAGNSTYLTSTSRVVTINVGATQNSTQITASVDKPTVNTTEPFNITGNLTNSSGAGIPYQTIHLDRWNGAAYVSTGVTNTTDAGGNFTLTYSESTAGTYKYEASFTGFASYSASNSTPITVTVRNRIGTQLSISSSAVSGKVASGQRFTLYGTLTNGTGGGIPNAPVNLQYSLDTKTWSSASSQPTTTGNGTNGSTNGYYLFYGSVTGQGLYYFRSVYAGNVTYLGSVSSTITINCTGAQSTVLYISVSNTTPTVNQPLLFYGQLYTTATKTPLSGEPVWLQASTDQKTWELGSALAANTVNGGCSFAGAIGSTGTYYFRLYHNATSDYLASYSSVVKVTVTSSSAKLATQLSITATPSSPGVGQSVIISGTLKTKESIPVPVAGGDVYLYWSSASGGTYYLASSSPSVTTANGVYAFSGSLPSGTYYFKTTYSGTSKYVAASSTPLKITVS